MLYCNQRFTDDYYSRSTKKIGWSLNNFAESFIFRVFFLLSSSSSSFFHFITLVRFLLSSPSFSYTLIAIISNNREFYIFFFNSIFQRSTNRLFIFNSNSAKLLSREAFSKCYRYSFFFFFFFSFVRIFVCIHNVQSSVQSLSSYASHRENLEIEEMRRSEGTRKRKKKETKRREKTICEKFHYRTFLCVFFPPPFFSFFLSLPRFH